MTLNEYRPEDDVTGPQRDPMEMVRWWSFLMGAAYTNPLHDLLHAHTLKPVEQVINLLPGRPKATFGADGVSLHKMSKKRFFPYTDITFLKLDYTCFYHRNSMVHDSKYFLRMHLETSQDRVVMSLQILKPQCEKLLKSLYARRVRFQEYYMGSRSFLLNADIPYKRIQELKAEYGLKW